MQDIELRRLNTTRTTDNVGSPPPTAPPEQTLPAGQSINVDDVAPIPQEYPLGHWVH